MNIVATPATCTPEDLLKMPDGDSFELVNGFLVERKMSTLSSFVAGNIYWLMADYCHNRVPGWPFPEGTSYQCFPNAPGKVRRADVSVFRWERRTLADFQDDGHCPLAPNLVVEVLSPNDTAYEMDVKLQEWLDAGVDVAWIVHPQRHTVEVHHASGPGVVLRESDEINGENAVPGFKCIVADFFSAPAKATAVS